MNHKASYLRSKPLSWFSTAPYSCSRAQSLTQYRDVFRIIYDSYYARNFIAGNAARLWITRHHLLPTTRAFIATNSNQNVGTLTLVEDGVLGLPMETLFGPEVDLRRNRFGPAVEATCLALNKSGRPTGLKIIDQLMGAVAQSARHAGATQILAAVHPRHAPFYIRMAGFSPFGQAKPYLAVRGQLAVPLAVYLPNLKNLYPAVYERYFDIGFHESVTSRLLTPQPTLEKLAQIWQKLQSGNMTNTAERQLHELCDRYAA